MGATRRSRDTRSRGIRGRARAVTRIRRKAATRSRYPQQDAPQYGNAQHDAPQYGGPQYDAPQYGGLQQGPQYGGPPRKSKGWIIILALVVLLVVVVLAIFAVLSRGGVIQGGPFAKGVPSVPPPSELPATAGGLYRLDDKEPATFRAAGAKYDWTVAKYYATKPQNQVDGKTPVYIVTVYGPLGDAKDALATRNNVTPVGSGLCADGSPSVGIRVCAVQRGSVVATVTENIKPTGRTASDDELIAYAAALANALS
ncbi:hypothetical protein GCM10009744_52270 [Kribbella alba]|uniref:DUF3558 domain-containing protein n=1 Tax=Kribbella alba TaxID=190197 RepID=A0ABN2FNR0_9ACTN